MREMAKPEEIEGEAGAGQKSRPIETTTKVTDHLANERTFLAWIRTGLATITFGFVVERFGLLLRELGIKNKLPQIPIPYSSVIGVTLTILGVIIIIIALANFLHIRRSIDAERFHPPIAFAVVLTILASVIRSEEHMSE